MYLLLGMGSLLITPSDAKSTVEGERLPALASAKTSAPGYDPKLAVDENEATVWVASLIPDNTNNKYLVSIGPRVSQTDGAITLVGCWWYSLSRIRPD